MFAKRANAQKTFMLRDYARKNEKVYNFSGSEMYMVINGSHLFIPKTAPFEFRTSKTIDSFLINNDTLRSVCILIRNRSNDFIITIPIEVYRAQNAFGVYVYIENKKQYYRVGISEMHNWGFSSPQLIIKPNKLWKEKYYMPLK